MIKICSWAVGAWLAQLQDLMFSRIFEVLYPCSKSLLSPYPPLRLYSTVAKGIDKKYEPAYRCVEVD
ncbi:hypothetical protein Plhal304r1_c028g0094041 [Plasmopara halstedii]